MVQVRCPVGFVLLQLSPCLFFECPSLTNKILKYGKMIPMSFFHIWITAASDEFNAQHPWGHYSRRCHEARVSPMLWVVPLDGDEIQQITAIWCNLVSWDVDLYRLGSNHPTWSILRPANPWSDYHLRGFFSVQNNSCPNSRVPWIFPERDQATSCDPTVGWPQQVGDGEILAPQCWCSFYGEIFRWKPRLPADLVLLSMKTTQFLRYRYYFITTSLKVHNNH